MELFSYFRSSAAYRVRIALNLKGVDYQLQPVNLLEGAHRGDAYRKINPLGLVPALRLENGQILTQSTAILEWLEEQYPSPPLLPQNSIERSQVRAWVNCIACDVHPINNLRVLNYLTKDLKVTDEQKNAWYQHWINLGFTALEQQISGTPFCHPSGLSLADIYLIPQVYNALRFKVSMASFPKISAIYQHCNQLDAFIQAAPEQQPDCP